MDDTIAVRPGDELPLARLDPYLRERIPEATGPLCVRQFAGGLANLTYLLRFGEREYVLRRPPHGTLPKSGHDMRREYRVLSVLYRAFPLAPRAYVLCTDPAIAGSDFVVMERRRGSVIRETLPESLRDDPAACARLAERFISTLAALHAVDYGAVGLGALGRPDGFLARQLAGWIERWYAAQTPDRPDAARLIERLRDGLPPSGPPALVHNDFKFDNTLVSENDPTQPVAVLDWDMCTLGDPLVDVGNVVTLWTEAHDPARYSVSAMPTAYPGFPSRAELIERYARATGRDCSRVPWYHAYNVFRYAAIAQQIYARYVRGEANDERFAHFGGFVASLVARGTALADRGL